MAIVRAPYSIAQYLNRAHALIEGGIPTLEFTIEQPHALPAISELRRSAGDQVWVGAGTVRDLPSARRAVEAGAQFLVSPAFTDEVAQFASENHVPYLPGVLTPIEVEAAARAGCDLVKLFPARPLGPGYLKAIAAPLTGIDFLPTGGIGIEDAPDFIAAGAFAVGLGGSLVAGGDSAATVRERARELVNRLAEVASSA